MMINAIIDSSRFLQSFLLVLNVLLSIVRNFHQTHMNFIKTFKTEKINKENFIGYVKKIISSEEDVMKRITNPTENVNLILFVLYLVFSLVLFLFHQAPTVLFMHLLHHLHHHHLPLSRRFPFPSTISAIDLQTKPTSRVSNQNIVLQNP